MALTTSLSNIDEGNFTTSYGEKMQNYVFVVNENKKPLEPVHPAAARKMLKAGEAAVWRRVPFTIIRKDTQSDSNPCRLKIDPGSKVTGLAIVDQSNRVVWCGELHHKGFQIKKALEKRRILRRARRSRKTRYRKNKVAMYMGKRRDGKQRRQPMPKHRRKGWLPPSLMSRVDNIETWMNRLCRYVWIDGVSVENVKFDTQKMENAEILGVEYQQGTLQGYTVREYILEKFNRKCIYCGKKNVPLEVEHIVPKSRGGSNRIDNLALSCVECNREKGNRTAVEFGHPNVQKKVVNMRDVAAVNATRWRVYEMLLGYWGDRLEVGSGARTKFNRRRGGYSKEHWIDAACVGKSGDGVVLDEGMSPLMIKAVGWRGSGSGLVGRQMVNTDKYGFPKGRAKGSRSRGGVTSGDLVMIWKHEWSNIGPYIGHAGLSNNSISIPNAYEGKAVQKSIIKTKDYRILHKSDGYKYSWLAKGDNK